ncbi:hypothetical protein Har1131_20995 [Haloarcula sp. CBA1131]|uniref:DUF8131 domain-containing protein n=1 Tax=Haloarcula marismortui ATCC 33799 TaxID=662475 RepID=M0K251_9EURY|nr:hypothetical protein C435_15247 [Haloarcula californiae ATCC 33799]KAA9401077.1 hypothetical protein Har1131_20995 [Haloarcula sp. CBA1131]
MLSMPASRLPLVGLLAIPFVAAFVIALEPVAFLAIINTVLIVIAVRLMFGSDDLDTLEREWPRIR